MLRRPDPVEAHLLGEHRLRHGIEDQLVLALDRRDWPAGPRSPSRTSCRLRLADMTISHRTRLSIRVKERYDPPVTGKQPESRTERRYRVAGPAEHVVRGPRPAVRRPRAVRLRPSEVGIQQPALLLLEPVAQSHLHRAAPARGTRSGVAAHRATRRVARTSPLPDHPRRLEALRTWVRTAPVDSTVLKHSVALRVWLGHLIGLDSVHDLIGEHVAATETLISDIRRAHDTAPADTANAYAHGDPGMGTGNASSGNRGLRATAGQARSHPAGPAGQGVMTKLTPAAAAVVDAMEANFPALETMPAAQGRHLVATAARPPLPVIEVDDVVDRTAPGPGGDIPVRIFRPRAADGLPVIVYFHGGGFVIGDLNTYDRGCRASPSEPTRSSFRSTIGLRPSILSRCDRGRRRRPQVGEHACLRTWRRPNRMAVAGDSAGGTLAAVTAVHAAYEAQPALRAQLLIYPGTHLGATTKSRQEFARPGYFLFEATMQFFEDCYLGTATADDPDVSPLFTPGLVAVCRPRTSCCPNVTPARRGDRLRATGLQPPEYRRCRRRTPACFTAFSILVTLLPEAAEASAAAYSWLRGLLDD